MGDNPLDLDFATAPLSPRKRNIKRSKGDNTIYWLVPLVTAIAFAMGFYGGMEYKLYQLRKAFAPFVKVLTQSESKLNDLQRDLDKYR